ncbi:hypothetical protein [Saccharopolyspora pogona]|uniref:hypothetical protein n=1 Tax=Saccharopolyspora pogona TaxID=333966 RepID=UPI001CC24ACB|nr:hypothetical protein [Saccharopolyspora pogona]
MPGIVPDEGELREHSRQHHRCDHLPPGVTKQHECHRADREQPAVARHPRRIVATARIQQAALFDQPGQLREVATAPCAHVADRTRLAGAVAAGSPRIIPPNVLP